MIVQYVLNTTGEVVQETSRDNTFVPRIGDKVYIGTDFFTTHKEPIYKVCDVVVIPYFPRVRIYLE